MSHSCDCSLYTAGKIATGKPPLEAMLSLPGITTLLQAGAKQALHVFGVWTISTNERLFLDSVTGLLL